MSLLKRTDGPAEASRTPSYQQTGQLDFANQHVQLRNFIARVGNSDLNVLLRSIQTTYPPKINAKLNSCASILQIWVALSAPNLGCTTTRNRAKPPRSAPRVARAEAQPRRILGGTVKFYCN